MLCSDCDAEVESNWKYCQGCGAPLHADGEDPTEPLEVPELDAATNGRVDGARAAHLAAGDRAKGEGQTPPRAQAGRARASRWTRATVIAAAVLALVTGLGLLAVNDAGTHQSLGQTRASLALTRQKLSSTATHLKSTTSQLAAVTKERDSLSLQVLAQSSQVSGLQNSLADAQQQVNLQAGQISVLKTCLSGVSTALNDVAIGDYLSATSALDAVQVSCQSSAALFQ